MNLKVASILILYWSLFTIIMALGDTPLGGNPFTGEGYTADTDLNASGFDPNEEFDTDTGGLWNFFSGVSAVFVAMGRFFGLVVLGLTPAISGVAQFLFSTWQVGWSLFTIGFIIDSIWSG